VSNFVILFIGKFFQCKKEQGRKILRVFHFAGFIGCFEIERVTRIFQKLFFNVFNRKILNYLKILKLNIFSNFKVI